MNAVQIIPPFDFQRVVIDTWTSNLSDYGWIALMSFLVTTACGLVGNYLILRRMVLVGDAISHSVLPGLAIGFLIVKSRSSIVMFSGALIAAVVTAVLIELIHKKSRVKPDAAIGITFSTLFAIGVVIISVFASKVDLDQDCVLYGEINNVAVDTKLYLGSVMLGPAAVVRMGVVASLVLVLILVFYKELLVSSFDPGLSSSLGINATVVHYALMCVLSIVVVSAFESVGAILVIAMLVLPGATASLISDRLPRILALSILHAAVSSILGLHFAIWVNCAISAGVVVMAAFLFALAWICSPSQGLIRHLLRARRNAEATGVVSQGLADPQL